MIGKKAEYEMTKHLITSHQSTFIQHTFELQLHT